MIFLQQYPIYGPVSVESHPSWAMYYLYMAGAIIGMIAILGFFIGLKVWNEVARPRDKEISKLKKKNRRLEIEKEKDVFYHDIWFDAAKYKGMALGMMKNHEKVLDYMEGFAKAKLLERTSEVTALENENLRRQLSNMETQLVEVTVLASRNEAEGVDMRNEYAKLKNRMLDIKEQGQDLLDTALKALAMAKALNLPAKEQAEIQLAAESYARQINAKAVSKAVSLEGKAENRQLNGKIGVSQPFQQNETPFETPISKAKEIRFVPLENMEVLDRGGYAILYYKEGEYLLPYDKLMAGVPFRLSNSPVLFATLCGNCESKIKITYQEARFCSETCKNQSNNKHR